MMQAAASHELRNPLASLIYKLQGLKLFIDNSKKIEKRINNLIRAAEKNEQIDKQKFLVQIKKIGKDLNQNMN